MYYYCIQIFVAPNISTPRIHLHDPGSAFMNFQDVGEKCLPTGRGRFFSWESHRGINNSALSVSSASDAHDRSLWQSPRDFDLQPPDFLEYALDTRLLS